MWRRASVLMVVVSMLSGCSAESARSASGAVATQPEPHAAPFRVLMVTATRGFRHDSVLPRLRAIPETRAMRDRGAGKWILKETDGWIARPRFPQRQLDYKIRSVTSQACRE